jgi:hypothetical protein
MAAGRQYAVRAGVAQRRVRLRQRKPEPRGQAPNSAMGSMPGLESSMNVFKDLFTSDVGLMSAAGLLFMLGMGVFYIRYFLRHIAEDAAAQQHKH